MAAHIRFDQVSLHFAQGGVQALADIDLSIDRGEVLTILGPSGCGKTSLLRLIAGLITPDRGRVLVGGQPPQPGRDSAIVFQNFRLLPWKTVAGNLAFVLSDLPKDQRAARISHYLAMVGLTRFADSYPQHLSGGMQQRVALARALAAEPEILLMDEPFASLDAQSRELMQIEVAHLAKAPVKTTAPRTVVFVTHSVDEALILGDRVLLMAPRPGRVAETITLPFADQPPEARRRDPRFATLRDTLWARLSHMVLSDPLSDFHGRLGHQEGTP